MPSLHGRLKFGFANLVEYVQPKAHLIYQTCVDYIILRKDFLDFSRIGDLMDLSAEADMLD